MKQKFLILFLVSACAVFFMFEVNSSETTVKSDLSPTPAIAETVRDARSAAQRIPVAGEERRVSSKPALKENTYLAKPALDPRYQYRLTIPSIRVNAFVLGMGLTKDGKKMAVPNNFTEVGWYNLGPRPGEAGSAVLGAHVDNGGAIKGVFKNLKDLNVGDEIIMEDGEGKILRFAVVKRTIYDRDARDTREVFGSVGKPRLNLITCYGTFIPSLNTYDKRLVVFAELADS